MVRHPETLHPYVLRVKYLRSENRGPVFEKMSIKLDVIAAYEGMGDVFRLLAADIYEVLEIRDRGSLLSHGFSEAAIPHSAISPDLETARVVFEDLNRQTNLEDLLDQSLFVLQRHFGISNSFILLNDSANSSLITHATLGYPKGGVGSEVKHGEGLIGLCAKHKKFLQISGMREASRYTKAILQTSSTQSLSLSIPLPGLTDPASQMAAPIVFQSQLLGVLACESREKSWWDARDQSFVTMLANFLAAAIVAQRKVEESPFSERSLSSEIPTGSEKSWNYRYIEKDEVLFVNDQYLIKNIPAKILKYLLSITLKTGRREFSNMELRSADELRLPEVKDNLEARLILLRKRLQEHDSGLTIQSGGRGRFRLEINGKIEFEGVQKSKL